MFVVRNTNKKLKIISTYLNKLVKFNSNNYYTTVSTQRANDTLTDIAKPPSATKVNIVSKVNIVCYVKRFI